MLVGAIFSEIVVRGGEQKEKIQYFAVVLCRELVETGQFFLNEFHHSYLGSGTEHKISYSCFVIIDYHVIHIFYILLLPISIITSSDFHPIFTIDGMQKCESKVKGNQYLPIFNWYLSIVINTCLSPMLKWYNRFFNPSQYLPVFNSYIYKIFN